VAERVAAGGKGARKRGDGRGLRSHTAAAVALEITARGRVHLRGLFVLDLVGWSGPRPFRCWTVRQVTPEHCGGSMA